MDQVSGNTTSRQVDGLAAFTNYSFYLQACTEAGCTASNHSNTVTTLTYGTLFTSLSEQNKLEGKYSLESTDPRESEIRAHLHP